MRAEFARINEVSGYVLSDRLGSGGMGDVYKAWNPALQRWAAIKILHQKEMGERFRNEAFIQASVRHPNIATLYESSLNGPTPYIIMEYVEGEMLDQYMRRVGKVSNEAATGILSQIASALSYLHAKDILHRDIKPQNFKLQPDGTVKMLDFGIAKHKYSPKLTQQGFVVGTTEYMAPEQFRQQVEKQSDIWSLGVMLYEMLTGHLPFEAVNPFILQGKICKASFTDPNILVSGISPKLNSIIEKSLRVTPSSRIRASEISSMLGSGNRVTKAWKISTGALKKQPMAILGVFVLAAVIMFALISFGGEASPGEHVVIDSMADPKPVIEDMNALHITVDVPSVGDATILFPDGRSGNLPYVLIGPNGHQVKFTLHADGYQDRPVQLELNTRRRSYEYNLQRTRD